MADVAALGADRTPCLAEVTAVMKVRRCTSGAFSCLSEARRALEAFLEAMVMRLGNGEGVVSLGQSSCVTVTGRASNN